MSAKILPAGKLPVALLRELLDRHRPAPVDLLLPPAVGEDAGVVEVAGGALVVATDPITLTGREIGSHAVVINANDIAVMGVRPQWFLAVFLLPMGTTDAEVRALFDETHEALDRLGATLVGGHTEITAAVTQPIVVGQMLGYREDGRFLRTSDVSVGDVILQIGPALVEGAAVLAVEAGERLTGLAPALVAKAREALREPGISVVEQALLATSLGATAMHDPTEGGLSAGLHELAEASKLALRVDTDAVLWFEPGKTICAALGADPWGVLASGTLLAAFPEETADSARSALEAKGYHTAIVARAEPGTGICGKDGCPLPRHEQDEVSRVLTEQQS